jgi:hypothetical protein
VIDDRGWVERVLAQVPLDGAMPELVHPPARRHPVLAQEVQSAPISGPVAAGLLLLLDELDASHEVSQSLPDSVGSYWHGVMHRREGDFWNSEYWFQRAGPLPFLTAMPGFDPAQFVREVQKDGGRNEARLVEAQRWEWVCLMEWILQETPGGERR